MYSMVLDSVREKNESNQVMAEVSLMRAALLGNPAVLAPNQAMDSLALQEIVLANNTERYQSNYFCKAVESGIVRVAIPDGFRDLIDWSLSSLSRGSKNEDAEFRISGLKFLYEKDAGGREEHPFSQRSELTRYIIARLTEGNRSRSRASAPGWLTPDEKDMVERYIQSIVLLNKAVDTYESFTSCKQLFPRILEKLVVERLRAEEPGTETAMLLLRVRGECARPDAPIYRSYYYHLIDDLRGLYGREAAAEARAAVDVAYNKVVALSVRTGAEISIPNQFDLLTDSVIQTENPDYSFQSSYVVEKDVSCLDWEMIFWIYEEVQAIMEERGVNWWDALRTLYDRESRLPFVMSGKYMAFNAIKTGISSLLPGGGLIVNFLTGLIQNEMDAKIQGRAMIPGSMRETRERSSRSQKAVKLLDTVVFTELRGKSENAGGPKR